MFNWRAGNSMRLKDQSPEYSQTLSVSSIDRSQTLEKPWAQVIFKKLPYFQTRQISNSPWSMRKLRGIWGLLCFCPIIFNDHSCYLKHGAKQVCIVCRHHHVSKDHAGATEEPEAGDEEWEILLRAHPGLHRPFRRRTPGEHTNTVTLIQA